MNAIHIYFKPPAEMRYQTVGDWTYAENGDLIITIAETPGHYGKSSQLVAIHELVEALLCSTFHISQEQVDNFDLNYSGEYDEPGEDPKAPYHNQHTTASIVERIVAQAMKLEWDLHETLVEIIDKKVEKALKGRK